MNNNLRDKVRGSLIGGAIGDALGYSIEFMSLKAIKHKYGDKGYINHQEFNNLGKAVISDDTQMTLFTANGLLNYITRITITNGFHWETLIEFITLAYKDWLKTQEGIDNYYYNDPFKCWIRDIKELNVRRAPGNTCISALQSLKCGKVENDSKGCGGVMRVAPIGLLAAVDLESTIKDYYGTEVQRREWDATQVARLGGDSAAITHKHPLGYLPAAFLADLIFHILMSEVPLTFGVLENYIDSVYSDIWKEYETDRDRKAFKELWALIEKAINLATYHDVSEETAIRLLGEGWTGDEALAIAIYCMMKHPNSFEKAVIAAVNHDGDSDSTGAICGNLMGAIVGYEVIPSRFTKDLELKDLILEIADDIVKGFSPEDEEWKTKYIDKTPYLEEPKSLFDHFIKRNRKYNIEPRALRAYEARKLIWQISSHNSDQDNGKIWYQLALKVYDTEDFDPIKPLEYHQMKDNPYDLFLLSGRKSQAAWYYGYDDPQYSPKNNNRVFKLNLYCFENKSPIIAVRKDGYGHIENELRAGLMIYYDKPLMDKYPGWDFYMIDPSTADVCYAVFTNQLEKEFAVEIAHLWNDGTLHRIYHLIY